MMDAIFENQRLARWAKLLPRGPNQHGAVHESDAELLPLGDGQLLALTVDQVAEEVTSGLYRQPETVGPQALTRLGAAPGDGVYATGLLGLGATMAAARFLELPEALFCETEFHPELRLQEGRRLRGIAACCMDTSDGVIATLDQLARLNNVLIRIDRDPADLLHPAAKRVQKATGLAATAFLAAVHGEFELVFSRIQTQVARSTRAGQGHHIGKAGSRRGGTGRVRRRPTPGYGSDPQSFFCYLR